ncbi:MAG: antibiotic biosynthesis monooxygenase family protein [Gammaproteobacteria bacterium]|nr:antibiotic biosynthesis monooxygenase family protein [Gammaproteobacteria bacterium]
MSAFIAMSRFAVANTMLEEVKEAFRQRPKLVDQAQGFIKMDVISPLEHPDEIWLITYWKDRDSYLKWHHSEEHKQSHKGIPKGLKLVPERTEISFFEHVTD